jgi:hypothetical protein
MPYSTEIPTDASQYMQGKKSCGASAPDPTNEKWTALCTRPREHDGDHGNSRLSWSIDIEGTGQTISSGFRF